MPIRLFVIDFGSPYIANLLDVFTPESGVEVAGRASDLSTLMRLASEDSPDVVLIDAPDGDLLRVEVEPLGRAALFGKDDAECHGRSSPLARAACKAFHNVRPVKSAAPPFS